MGGTLFKFLMLFTCFSCFTESFSCFTESFSCFTTLGSCQLWIQKTPNYIRNAKVLTQTKNTLYKSSFLWVDTIGLPPVFHSYWYTTWPDKHGRIFPVPFEKWLVQCTLKYTRSLRHFLQGARTMRPCITGQPVPQKNYARNLGLLGGPGGGENPARAMP